MSRGRDTFLPHDATCVVCGQHFSTSGFRTMYCPDCKRIIVKTRNELAYHEMVLSRDEIIELARKVLRGEDVACSKRTRKYERQRVGVCKWCGYTRAISESGFCACCRHEGYDNIYAVTGRVPIRTQKKKVPIVDGWRGGGHVAGCVTRWIWTYYKN